MKINYLANTLRTAENIVCLAGKGMSREMGIHTYAENAKAYEIEELYGRSPEELYTAQCLATRPEKFYKYYKTEVLMQDQEPGAAYYALAEIQKKVNLSWIITRSIYDFPNRAGCQRVINLHGTIFESHCPRCGQKYQKEYILEAEKVPLCEKCGIPLNPGVTMMGEMVDNHTMTKAADAVSKADVLLVLGANLRSNICSDELQYFQGEKLILINSEKHYMDHLADISINENVEDVLQKLLELL